MGTAAMMSTSLDRGLGKEGPWYAPHPKIRTEAAADQASRIARWTSTGRGLAEDPDEHQLFVALHTCAYQAAGKSRTQHTTRNGRQRWFNRWRTIRDHIVQSNLGLVYSTVARFRLRNVSHDDLLSDAMLGLCRSVDRFNPWRGFRFSTYTVHVITRRCLRHGRREMRYRQRFKVHQDLLSDVAFARPDQSMELYIDRLKHVLKGNLGDLTATESRVLENRFPFDGVRPLTFQQIGDSIGLSKERVRQIQNSALHKLRNVMETDPLLK